MTRIEQQRSWLPQVTWPARWSRGFEYQGIVPVLAAAVLAFGLTRALWSTLAVGQVYNDLVVGGLSWGDLDKSRDFRALALFIGTMVAGSFGITWLVSRVVAAFPSPGMRKACDAILIFALVPALWRLGVVLANPFVTATPKDAALVIVVALLILGILPRYRERLSAQAIIAAGGRVLLLLGMAIFAGLAVGLALGRIWPAAARHLGEDAELFTILPAAVAAIAGLAILARSARLADAQRSLDRLLLVAQIPLPLLVLAVLPSTVMRGEQLDYGAYRATLPIALGGYVAAALVNLALVYRRWRASVDSSHDLRGVCAPLCLAALAVFVVLPPHSVPEFWADSFQAGEELLPWHQWTHFGKLPWVDFAPIHGLMPLLRGWIGDVCFAGTAADYWKSELVLMALGAVATYLALHAAAGPMIALFLTAFATPLNNRFYFLTPALVILVWPALLDRPRRWLIAWLSLSTFMVLYNASLGTAYTVGTSPAAVWMAWRLWQTDRRGFAQLAAGMAAVALAALAITPIRLMAFGLLRFIYENAVTNELVSGIPFHADTMPPRERYPVASTQFFWQSIRFSWLLVVVVAAVQYWRQWGRGAVRDRRLLWLAAIVPLPLLLTAAWALNRIDPAHLSRTGEMSKTVVAFLLPLLLLFGRSLAELPAIVGGLAVLGGFVISLDPYEGRPPFIGTLEDRIFAVRPLPPEPHMIEGAKVGLPQLGHIRIEPNFLEEIQQLQAVFAEFLRPGETFLDLCSNSANYYYLDLPVPSLYSAHFVAAGTMMQARMLEQLRADPPPVVLIAPRDDHDGGPPPLRSYHLYREYVEKYVLVERGKFVLLVDPSRAPEVGPVGSPEQIEWLEKILGQGDLAQIATAWGRNWDHLAERFDEIGTLAPLESPDTPRDEEGRPASRDDQPFKVSYSLGEQPIAGGDADFALVRLANVAQSPRGPTRMAVRWRYQDGAAAPGVWMTASSGTLLIPLGASPRWLLSRNLAELQFEIHPNGTDEPLRVEEVRLLRLKPPL